MKRKVKRNRHVPEWTFIGAAIVLGTMACSFSLPDVSNLPRLIALTVALGVALLCSAKVKCAVPRGIGAISFALFVVFTGLSTIWAVNKGEAIYDNARWAVAAGLLLTIYNLYRRYPAHTITVFSRAAAVIIIPSVAMAVWQIVQLDGDLQWDNRYSINSLYSHKGTFSLVMLMVSMPIGMRLRLRMKRARVFYIVLLGLVAAMLLFLSSRTALLALAAIGVVLLLTLIPLKPLSPKWHIPATIVVAALLGVILIGGSRLFTRLPIGDTPGSTGGVLSSASIYERYALWNCTLNISERHPLCGVGAGNWKVCYPEVSTAEIFSVDVLDFNFVRPHNEFLKVLSETGLVGLALFLLALASPIVRAIGRSSRRRKAGRMTALSLAWLAAAVVAALVDFPLDRTETFLWCMVTVAILSASTASARSSFRTNIHAIPAALIMFAVVWIAVVRMGCEKKYPEITAANHAQMWKTMERAAHDAHSPLCSLTPIGTPVAYYEAMAREKQGKEALSVYASALHDSPWHKQSLNDMARLVYITHQDADSAEALFKKAIYVSPSFSYAYFNLAQLYIQEGRLDKARETLLSFDLDKKQQQIDRLIWHYHTGETALYYQHKLVPAERKMRDQLLSVCSNH